MTTVYRAKTFKSGNSVALRLPKGLGIHEGIEMKVREEQGHYIVERIEEPRRKLDVDKFWGKAKGMVHIPESPRDFEPRPSSLAKKS